MQRNQRARSRAVRNYDAMVGILSAAAPALLAARRRNGSLLEPMMRTSPWSISPAWRARGGGCGDSHRPSSTQYGRSSGQSRSKDHGWAGAPETVANTPISLQAARGRPAALAKVVGDVPRRLARSSAPRSPPFKRRRRHRDTIPRPAIIPVRSREPQQRGAGPTAHLGVGIT